MLLAFTQLTACSLRLNEAEEPVAAPLKGIDSSCLTDVGTTIDKFSAGSISDSELGQFWNCTERALVTFVENTRGKKEEYFLPKEFGNFVGHYLTGRPVPETLLSEAMALKQAFLGGRHDRITKDELRKTIQLFRVIGTFTRELRPFMPLTPAGIRAKKMNAQDFDKAIETFERGFHKISETIEASQGPYSFQNMENFLKEFHKVFYQQNLEQGAWVNSVLKWTDALKATKGLLISQPAEEIQQGDWSRIHSYGPRYYSLFLRTQFYFQSEQSYTHGPSLLRLETLFSDAVELLERIVENHPNGVVAESSFKQILDALERNQMLPVSRSTADSVLTFALNRLLTTPENREGITLTKDKVARLKMTFRFAMEGFRGIELLYRSEFGGEEYDRRSLPLSKFESLLPETLLTAAKIPDSIAKDAMESVKASALEIKLRFPNNSLAVLINNGPLATHISLGHLTKIHALRSLNRLVAQAYGNVSAKEIQTEQVQSLASDVFPILLGLGLVEPKARESVKDRLFEASLFLPSSDGKQSLTMAEALELQALLLSTLVRGDALHGVIAKSCSSAKKNHLGSTLIDFPCYRKEFLAMRKDIWAIVPGLAEYVGQLKSDDQGKIFQQLERFLRKDRIGQSFLPADSQSFILLPYYVELLFQRFDENRDGRFDNKEAKKAYVVFQPFLAAKAGEHGLNSDEDHQALFYFLLAYQELPNNMKFTWGWRRYITGPKNFRVDRGQVLTIFERLLTIDQPPPAIESPTAA
jgi:hypothetical protein